VELSADAGGAFPMHREEDLEGEVLEDALN
jgi:hypothetical protein